MTAASLTIDLDAIAANWLALNARTGTKVETAAVIKADAYGLGVGPVAQELANAGVRSFFVAVTEEGAALRKAIGPRADIYVFSGCDGTDVTTIRAHELTPLLNSPQQVQRFFAASGDAPFAIQLDSGMNRLGMEPADYAALSRAINERGPKLIISHLACADEPDHPQNLAQLECFRQMTDGVTARRSLAATGGVLLGPEYHFDLCRPGVGLYGGLPFADAQPVVTVSVPVIQTREVSVGETVGYAASWTAKRPTRLATTAAGYADGLIRAMGNGAVRLWSGDTPCPLVGRVSMDLITVDVTDLPQVPDHLEILNKHQRVDDLADAAGTIGYEILTSLGGRYNRRYIGGK
ncbi:MAG: alanine racemase [Rhodobacteraceae bacterium]|nr:alanine racemase [Paracoccaceae bacterium]